MAAWTATLVYLGKRANDEGAQVFTVVYTDGQSKLQRDYARQAFSLKSLQAEARDEVRRLQAEPPTVDLAGVQVGMLVDLTSPIPDPPPPPTQDELDRSAFLVAYQTVQRLSRAVAAGLAAADDKAVADAKATMQALYTPAYEALL